MRVLVIEDDAKMARLLREALEGARHDVDVASSGERGIDVSRTQTFDAIVLDVMLPGIDGFETCRRLRARGVWTPVLMLTARDGVEDRVEGLDAGSDDYLVKPFSLSELLARLRALGRRGDTRGAAVSALGDLRVDAELRRAWRGDIELDLTRREFDLLRSLMHSPGRAFPRYELLDLVWADEADVRSNVVDQYIRYLREKVDRPFGVRSIETVRGIGYRIVEASRA